MAIGIRTGNLNRTDRKKKKRGAPPLEKIHPPYQGTNGSHHKLTSLKRKKEYSLDEKAVNSSAQQEVLLGRDHGGEISLKKKKTDDS